MGITTGPDGALWLTEHQYSEATGAFQGKIGRHHDWVVHWICDSFAQ